MPVFGEVRSGRTVQPEKVLQGGMSHVAASALKNVLCYGCWSLAGIQCVNSLGLPVENPVTGKALRLVQVRQSQSLYAQWPVL